MAKKTDIDLEALMALPDEELAGRIAYLREFMLDGRAASLEKTLVDRTRYLTVCMENTFHCQNASALVRNCEAFGVQDIYTVDDRCRFSPHTHIVRGTDKWVDIRRHGTTAELLESLRAKGYRIVATSPHAGTTPETFDVEAGPFALFFGTEHAGISPEVEAAAGESIRIPMCGFVESLNVSASAAILLYILSGRLRASSAPWSLTSREQAEILLRWMITTVRDPQGIMSRYNGL